MSGLGAAGGIACQVRDLEVRGGDRIMLALPHLEVGRGEIVALTGANGTGKSTLLRALGLLLRPDRGTVELLGERAWLPEDPRGRRADRLRREVTLMHQRPVLFDADVATNVGFGLRARGVDGRGVGQQVAGALDRVGLSGFERRRARRLSGGEARRVVLARALVLRTAVLLLDEPFSTLDERARPLLLDIVRERREAGAAVLVTTHDVAQLAGLEDRVVTLGGAAPPAPA